jgi:hypothetical protein
MYSCGGSHARTAGLSWRGIEGALAPLHPCSRSPSLPDPATSFMESTCDWKRNTLYCVQSHTQWRSHCAPAPVLPRYLTLPHHSWSQLEIGNAMLFIASNLTRNGEAIAPLHPSPFHPPVPTYPQRFGPKYCGDSPHRFLESIISQTTFKDHLMKRLSLAHIFT